MIQARCRQRQTGWWHVVHRRIRSFALLALGHFVLVGLCRDVRAVLAPTLQNGYLFPQPTIGRLELVDLVLPRGTARCTKPLKDVVGGAVRQKLAIPRACHLDLNENLSRWTPSHTDVPAG